MDEDRRKQEVIRAERAWLSAHLELDLEAMSHLMADEYTQVSDQGELLDTQQVLASFEGGDRRGDYAGSDEYRVQMYGDVALVYGRWKASDVNAGFHFDYVARYLSAWIYRDGRWQIASDQSTEIPSR